MPTTLSPFRYFQIAQYVLRRWLDHASLLGAGATGSSSQWKGKGRAVPLLRSAGASASAMGAGILDSGRGMLQSASAGVEERRTWNDMVPSLEHARGRSPLGGEVQMPTSRSGGSGGQGAGPSRRPGSGSGFEVLRPDPRGPGGTGPEPEIYRLMNDPRLLEPSKGLVPREVVVLCHGLYGFSTATPIPLFPSLKLHYWASVLEVLRDRMGANVLVVGVKGTGSVKERAEQMHQFLKTNLPKGSGVNFVAHSMGGLDCRHLISNIRPTTYKPLSLTTIGTPHRGSPFMDWCAANIGVGSAATAAAAAALSAASPSVAKALPYSLKSPLLARIPDQAKNNGLSAFTAALTSYLLNIFDSPAYSNLTTRFLADDFNPETPDMDGVRYTSVAGRTTRMSVLHPLWFPKLILDAAAENGYGLDGSGPHGHGYEGNDGLVSVASAKWGHYLGAVDDCHHWDLRGEGGLFPTGFMDGDKKKPVSETDKQQRSSAKPDKDKDEAGWDWQGDFGNGVSEHLGLAADAARNAAGSAVDNARQVGAAAAARVGLGTVSGPPPTSNRASNRDAAQHDKGQPSSWDLNQVGQVLDWVGDSLPGGGEQTKERKMADARREMARDERDGREGREGAEAAQQRQGGGSEGGSKEKSKRSKFDLGRFYGGLMLKLRDDGL